MKNRREDLARRYADATTPLAEVTDRAKLATRAGVLAHTAREADGFVATADQLGEACATALHALVDGAFVPHERASSLAQLLAANETSLRQAVATYNAAVLRAADLRRSAPAALSAGRVAFGQVSRAQLAKGTALGGELASLSAARAPAPAATASVPTATRAAPSAEPLTDHAHLEAAQDIARLNAQTQAAEHEADAILESSGAETPLADNTI